MSEKLISNDNIMIKSDLEKLNQSELINLLLNQDKMLRQLLKEKQQKPIAAPRTMKPIPTPRKSVKQMVQSYEDNIILPPPEFRDDFKPVPKPRTVKPSRPIPLPRTKIEQTNRALKGYTKSFEINIKYNKDPLNQMQNTRSAVKHHINTLLNKMKGLKFVETLKITFRKVSGDETIEKNAYFNSTVQTIINETQINEALQLSKQIILNKIAQWVSEGLGWIIKSVDKHFLNIVKYKPMNGSSYIKLPTELQNSKKGLINLKNEDNECFRSCHIRHLNPQKTNPQRIKKVDKKMVNELNYKDIEFPVTIKQINKIEKQNDINISVFGYENGQPFPIYISKEKFKNHVEMLLITENENKHHVLISDFNKFMFNQTNHDNKKHFCMHCLQCFSSERVLTDHGTDQWNTSCQNAK